jgi:hypothetical protein
VKFMIDLLDRLLQILYEDEAVRNKINKWKNNLYIYIYLILVALLFVIGRNKKSRNDILFGETKDTGLISLTINALYNSIGEHRALKYVRLFVDFYLLKTILFYPLVF